MITTSPMWVIRDVLRARRAQATSSCRKDFSLNDFRLCAAGEMGPALHLRGNPGRANSMSALPKGGAKENKQKAKESKAKPKERKSKPKGGVKRGASHGGASDYTRSDFGARRVVRGPLALIAAIALAGCAAEPILETVELGYSNFVTTDAQQRVIINNSIGENSVTGLVDPLRMTCTEPSPDVATATASSFGAALSRPGIGSASFSAQHVQALAQLVERTASIQLLRDKMYQTCLAYANGAITGTTYTVIMSNLDQTVLSLLLGETAGGAFGRSLASIDTNAEGEARSTTVGVPAAVEELTTLTDELVEAQADVDEKRELAEARKALAEGDDSTPQAEQEAREAEEQLAAAVARRDDILDRLQSHAETIVTGSAEADASADGNLTDRTDPLIAETLAAMQESFIYAGLGDSVMVACLSELGITPGQGPTPPNSGTLTAAEQRVTQAFNAMAADDSIDSDLYDIAISERERVMSGYMSTRRDPPSALGTFCQANLPQIVSTATTNRQEVQRQRLRQQAARVQAERAAAIAEALSICQEFSDGAQQECLAKIPDPQRETEN